MVDDSDDDQSWTDLLKWAREHAPELVDIIENPASDLPDSAVPRNTALWFWEDNSQNKLFINEQRAKRLADYYSRHIDAEILEPMQRNFDVDRGRADRFAKRWSIRHDLISEVQLQWVRKHAPELLVDNDTNFRIWKPSGRPLDPLANDPKAERRRTQKLLRRVLIRKAFRAYMMTRATPKWGDHTKAVRQILEGWASQGWASQGWAGKGFERTIWRALNLRRTK